MLSYPYARCRRGTSMLHWWRQRRADRERVARQADELIALHGDEAYSIARDHRIRTLQEQQHREHRSWSAVAKCIAVRTGREVGLDTATRYLEAFPRDRNDVSSEHMPSLHDESALPIAAPGHVLHHVVLVSADATVITFPGSPSARRARGRRRPASGLPGTRPDSGSGSSR